jgi:vacuolar-type H+-ATPase subunit E/Vma4
MNDFDGVLGMQVQSLVEAIRRHREQRCREIVADAEHKAKNAVREARGKLYERQRRSLQEERERRGHELHVAASRIESGARQRTHANYGRILEAAWPRLEAALARRWAAEDGRRAWCETLVADAAGALIAGDWVVEHPVGWSAEDRDAVIAMITERGIPAPEFRADETIGSGLRFRAASACLDGTAAGLLASRGDVEALLLAAWEQQGIAADD